MIKNLFVFCFPQSRELVIVRDSIFADMVAANNFTGFNLEKRLQSFSTVRIKRDGRDHGQ